MEYYLALKINELSSHEKTWRNLACIFLSERTQSEKATYCVILTIRHSGKGTTKDQQLPETRGVQGEGGLKGQRMEVFNTMYGSEYLSLHICQNL